MAVDKRFGLVPPTQQGDGYSFPVTQGRGFAPPPLIDKYPIVIGQGLSLSYVAACLRTALTGYRQQLVDLLDELLQKDPHAYSVVWKRVLGVAGARLELRAPEIEEDDPDFERAEEIRKFCKAQLEQIPKLRQHIAFLAWASYYALTAWEIHWDRKDFGGKPNAWVVAELGDVFSRRLSYPDTQSWDLYIWDQGQVTAASYFGSAPTNQVFGLRISDCPNKFVVHAPQLRGDYPTREGVGIQIAEWVVLKRLGGRGASKYLERFADPWIETIWNKTPGGKDDTASEDDEEDAKKAAAGLSSGTTKAWAHSAAVKSESKQPEGAGTKAITFAEWLQICNAEISKPIVGNTLTTDVGKTGGNRALGEVHQDEELRILKYDAQSLCDTMHDQLLRVMVAKNYGAEAVRLTPHAMLHVEEPDPKAHAELAKDLAGAGVAVDGDRVAENVGVPTIANKTKQPRRMFPVKPVEIGVKELAPDLAPEEPEPSEDAQAPIARTTTNGIAGPARAANEGDEANQGGGEEPAANA